MEINTKTWKKFKVGDLFDAITKTSKVKSFEKSDRKSRLFNIPALSSTVSNNSFGYYVKECDHDLINEISLSVTSNGDAGKVYVQTEAFAIAQDAYALKLKNDINYGKKQVYLFLATVLEKILIQKYSYTNKAVWSRVKKEHILLPEKDSEPDWEFMTLYIKEIKDKCIDKIEKLNDENIKKALEVAGLTEEDINKELVLPVCDRYKEFRVGDLFDGDLGDTDIKAEDINDMGYPTITSGTYDFGVLGNTDVPAKIISKNTITIDMFGNSYYRTFDYKLVTHARVFSLIPKFNTTKNAGLYLKTSLFYLTKMFGYSNMCSYNKIKELFLNLPAIDKNTPDFDFMEVYIYIYQSSLKIRNWITKERLS